MAKLDPEVLAHLEWIGFVQPKGLVVSAPALARAGANLDRHDIEGQWLLRACVEERTFDAKEGSVPTVPDFRTFAQSFLGWSFSPKGYAGTAESPIATDLEVQLSDYGETLRPDFAVREPDAQNGASPWQLLVRVLPAAEDFDASSRGSGHYDASGHSRMERLLRQTGVPAGVLFNGRSIRLISAPRGESSGWIDFHVVDMLQTAGRPICTAVRLLLGQMTLLSRPRAQRLAALLEDSRKFQNEVSERLAEQVLHALYEFLRGFQAAHDQSKGELLKQVLADHPDEVYRALLTVILRFVFLLYAEERDMLPKDGTFQRNYSLADLYDRLREDAALHPDTMDQRYGAWAQLLVLFRMIHDGAKSGDMNLPTRHGVLFDPDRFPFLEGRIAGGVRQTHEGIEPPLVPDGTIYRAMEKLLVLDGDRISYRALDVEQIGSVYETMMGFRLENATGRSVAIKAQKKGGAPTAIDLEALLAEAPAKRVKWIQDCADRKLSESVKQAVADAATLEDLHAALQPVIDVPATPDLVPKGAMVLQPSEERRRSGSHYTPRSLTEPIVRTTLEPILARLRGEGGPAPTPEQILDLKVCDPAMGSGAFLVEACRYLGKALLESWAVHGGKPKVPPDEDDEIFARRLVAQRCLYGVDKNPVAVDLAKVSLWLATLARDHALTFVDHAIRHGDSLVGLTRTQIEAFHWHPDAPNVERGFETMRVREQVEKVNVLRERIREAGEGVSDREVRDRWDEAQFELFKVRFYGDMVIAAYFDGDTPAQREKKRSQYANAVVNGEAERFRGVIEERRIADPPLVPFHWDVECPEVFDRTNGGFDAVIGNPPFLGGTRLEPILGRAWRDYVVETVARGATGTRGAGDLAAYFVRRGFDVVRRSGTLGLLTTNSISQGDTRTIGLSEILKGGGEIYAADRSMPWPGAAGIEVARVWICKGLIPEVRRLNGLSAVHINSLLRDGVEPAAAKTLDENKDVAFEGVKLIGDGFILDKTEALELLAQEPTATSVVLPFLSGQDINSHPDSSPSRWAINFWDWPLDRFSAPSDYVGPVAADFPRCLAIVKERVFPFRMSKPPDSPGNRAMRERWWQYFLWRPGMYRAIRALRRVLVRSRVSNNHALVFSPSGVVLPDLTIVFALDVWASFCTLQSRVHEEWARAHGSTMRNDLRYTPSTCFQTFPFPPNRESDAALESIGETYYEFRAALMVKNDEGLTKAYNRFHRPDERDADIFKLRELHAAMDKAVLDAYGWTDIKTHCEFLLDYEIDEEEWGDKKKPYRYRWPDEVRDEVLARLLELNAQRAKEEAAAGAPTAKRRGNGTLKNAGRGSETEDLFS